MGYFGTPLILLLMLIGPFAVMVLLDRTVTSIRFSFSTAGCVGLATLFVFTGIGHFVKAQAMSEMLPEFFPVPLVIVYVSGVIEILLGVAVLVARLRIPVSWLLILMLLLLTPFNVYAAYSSVGTGGHILGPAYLWVRIPLQVFFMAWTYWFGVYLVQRTRVTPVGA